MTKYIHITLGFTLLISIFLPIQTQAVRINKSSPITIVDSNLDGVVLEMNSPGYQIEPVSLEIGNFDQIIVDGADSSSFPGAPQLPVFNAVIGVPPDGEISIEILSDLSTPITGSYFLAPAPSPKGIEDDLEPGTFTFVKDENIYGSDSDYPVSPAQIGQVGWLRDQRIVRISFYPFQYNPIQGTLQWHQQLRLKVNFNSIPVKENESQMVGISSSGGLVDLNTNPFESVFKENLLNYNTAKSWRREDVSDLVSQPSISPLQSPALKITVDHDGLYQISFQDLVNAGMTPRGIDPRNFYLTNQGQDIAIYVEGENDGSFNWRDTITFYGEGFRGDHLAEIYADEDQFWLDQFVYSNDPSPVFFDAQMNATMFEKYTDQNVYWLAVGDTPGLRMSEVDGTPSGADIPSYYKESIHREESHIWWSWHYTDEDTWLWDQVAVSGSTPVTHSYTATLSALSTAPYSATIRGELVAYTYNNYASPDHHTQFFINDTNTLIDDAIWDGHTEYTFEVQTLQSNLLEGENQLFFVAQKTTAMSADYLYFDWFEIDYARQFEAAANQLNFSKDQSGTFQYQSHGFTNNDIQVFDITSAVAPVRILNPDVESAGPGEYTAAFEVTHDANSRFFVAAVGGSGVIQDPLNITYYTPQDFSSTEGVDYILITHHDFLTATQTLADYRTANGLSTLVVDVDELYNQFNFGIYNPIAIKNFLSYTFSNWTIHPSYAILIGSGHWDMHHFKDFSIGEEVFMPPNLAFVDPWQGEVDSANLLVNIVGDDILPDLAIGRIPITTEQELYNLIDKIITFESTSMANWQRNLVFVTDNVPDPAGNFIAPNEYVINNELDPGYHPIRIYQNDYGCTSSGSSACRAVTKAITETLNITGALMINYTGHGANNRWSGEQILKNGHLATLNNEFQPSIFIDITCLTGYWIHPDPSWDSLAVKLITLENAGAASTFSPTGLGVGQGHDLLHIGFYEGIFKSGVRDLGSATIAAKLKLFQAGISFDLINTYTIFGDPALKIPITYDVFLPSIYK